MLLVACGSAKREGQHKPRNLYTGSLFRAACAYVESTGEPWVIVSARHGVLDPDGDLVATYDFTVGDMGYAMRQEWAAQVKDAIGVGPHVSLMGSAYESPLRSVGVILESPLAGMGMGQRIGWLINASKQQERLWAE